MEAWSEVYIVAADRIGWWQSVEALHVQNSL